MTSERLKLNALCGYPRQLVSTQLAVLKACSQSTSDNPFIIARVTSDHPDPDDFVMFVRKGARLILVESGFPLHNLVGRTAVSKVEDRPLMWWCMRPNNMQEYLLGEEIEAGLTGSDGVVFRSSDVIENLNLDDFKQRVQMCREHGILVAIDLEKGDHLEYIPLKPDVYVTYDMSVALELQRLHDKYSGKQEKNENQDNLSDQSPDKLKPAVPFIKLMEGIGLSQFPEGIGIVVTEYGGLPDLPTLGQSVAPIVKVCGVKTVKAAKTALDSGANMIGMILVPGRSRTVGKARALEISRFVHSYKRPLVDGPNFSTLVTPGKSIFEINAEITSMKTRHRPAVVGVFRNQSLQEVLTWQHELSLDFVQLHGSEPLDWCRVIPVPVIKRFTAGTKGFEAAATTGYHYLALLDSELGGEGKLVDWSAIDDQVRLGARFILAGGLSPENVGEALKVPGVCGVDVSGGVETQGEKDHKKIKAFVLNAAAVNVKPYVGTEHDVNI